MAAVKKPAKPAKRDTKTTKLSEGPARRAGRPSKYSVEYCDMLVAHMAKGNTFSSFAATIGCCRDTLNAWEKESPEFSAAHRVGLAHLEQVIVDRGWAIAMGQVMRTYKKTFIIEGVPVEHEVTEPAVGNSGAFMAIAKNALGWSDKKEVTHSGPDGGPIKSERVTMSYEEKLARLATLRRQREAAGK